MQKLVNLTSPVKLRDVESESRMEREDGGKKKKREREREERNNASEQRWERREVGKNELSEIGMR